MRRKTRVVATLVGGVSAFLLGGAKPVNPPPVPFVPALAYKYGSQDIRLANADGSQAVLLVRQPSGTSPLWLAIAPISTGSTSPARPASTRDTKPVIMTSWFSQRLHWPSMLLVQSDAFFSPRSG